MNSLQIQQQILRSLGDDETSPERWSEAVVLEFANEGLEELSTRAKAVKKEFQIPLVSGIGLYDVSRYVDDFLGILDIVHIEDTVETPLLYKSEWELNDMSPSWRKVSGGVIYYYMRGMKQIGVAYLPTSGYLNIHYWGMAESLVDDADEPNIPVVLHSTLVDFGIYRCSLIEARDEKNYVNLFSNQWKKVVTSLGTFILSIGHRSGRLERLQSPDERPTLKRGYIRMPDHYPSIGRYTR